MMSQRRWQVYSRLPEQKLIDHLCVLRQLDVGQLNPNFTDHLHDPMLLPDMAAAIELIVEVVKDKLPVAIFGDYDADGTPAAVILSSALDRLGVKHEVFLPTRQAGYGLKMSDVDSIAKNARVLITVDTGVSAIEPVMALNARGVRTIILDHHLPHASLPAAVAVVDPYRLDSKYPFPELCGCALAFKFVQALSTKFPVITEGFCKWQLDLVAISTVADMMNIVGENRTLVHFGLEVLRKTSRPGLKALLEQAGLGADKISSSSIAFVIGPRFNALGRLSDNRPLFDLLKTVDPVKSRELAATVELANKKRQGMVEDVVEQARRVVMKQNSMHDKALLVMGEDWPHGVIGLVAGKLMETYYRPVIVGSLQDGVVRCSARSVPEYAIIEGLDHCAKDILTYGGHRQAAGCTINADRWNDFAANLKQHAAKALGDVELTPTLRIDSILRASDLDLATTRDLESLEPYGLGNSKPVLALKNATIDSIEPIGSSGAHLRLQISLNNFRLAGVAFQMRDRMSSLRGKKHLAGYLQNNRWQNRDNLQFQVIDFKEEDEPIEVAK